MSKKTSKKTAYINCVILDGTKDMVPVTGKVIIVDDTRIAAIEDAHGADLSGCEIVDLGGKFILPGLINLHVHLPGSGKPSKKPMNLERICKLITSCELGNKIGCAMVAGNAKNALMAGVTTVRSVGSISNYDSRVRDDIAKGKRVGPRILPANCAISVPGGHMAGTFAYPATSAEEAASLVDTIAKDKPALIKLMITGGIMDSDEVGEPGALRMPEDYIKAACDRAHELGYKVAAHCEGQAGVRAALKNGVDTIEHGAKPDAEIIDLMKKTGACQVLTLSPAIPYVKRLPGLFNLSEAAVTNSITVVDGMVQMAKTCLAEGITVGLGTDSACSYSTQYDMWRELVYYVKYCDVTPAFALHTATQINAGIAGIGDITGTIEVGKSADMIVVDEDPTKNLQTLRNVRKVIMEGRLIDSPTVKKYEETETVLDSF